MKKVASISRFQSHDKVKEIVDKKKKNIFVPVKWKFLFFFKFLT